MPVTVLPSRDDRQERAIWGVVGLCGGRAASASGSSPVVEQRAQASAGGRARPARALRWSSSERSERCGPSPRMDGNTQRRGGVRRGVAVCSRVPQGSGWPLRWSSSERQRASVETTPLRAPETFEILLHSCPECRLLGPGVSVVDARIPCMTTVFDDTRQHPVAPDRRDPRRPRRARRPRGCGRSAPPRPPTNLAALTALRHRITELELRHRPPRRPPRPRRSSRCHRHRRLVGQHHPADQAGRQTSPRLANALDCDHEPVRDAMAAGRSPRTRRW